MVGLLTQIKAFGLTLLLGVLAGGIFHYYQLTLKSARPGKYSLYLLDFILWMFLILVVFVALLLINQGEIRIYVFIALLAGVFVYYRYLWQRMTRPLSHTARATVAAYATILGWGQRPWGWLKTYIKSRKKETPPPDASE